MIFFANKGPVDDEISVEREAPVRGGISVDDEISVEHEAPLGAEYETETALIILATALITHNSSLKIKVPFTSLL